MINPKFTQEQKDFICHQIGDWYLMMKPLLEGPHNLGYMKEKLKKMVCGECDHLFIYMTECLNCGDIPDEFKKGFNDAIS